MYNFSEFLAQTWFLGHNKGKESTQHWFLRLGPASWRPTVPLLVQGPWCSSFQAVLEAWGWGGRRAGKKKTGKQHRELAGGEEGGFNPGRQDFVPLWACRSQRQTHWGGGARLSLPGLPPSWQSCVPKLTRW